MEVLAITGERHGPAPGAGDHSAPGGDFTAFEELYHRHVRETYALCLRMTGSPHRAEELTQAAFVRAWEKLPSFRGDAKFSTWLHRLTVNVVLGEHRSRGRREERESAWAEPLGPRPLGAVDPATDLDLEQAIVGLPDRARQVFVLHDVEGYRHDEIGRLLGVSPGTSKAQLHRARKLLREALRR